MYALDTPGAKLSPSGFIPIYNKRHPQIITHSQLHFLIYIAMTILIELAKWVTLSNTSFPCLVLTPSTIKC